MANQNSNSILWGMAGVGIGAVAGILWAPKAGAETRSSLRSRAADGVDQLKQTARIASDKAAHMAHETAQFVERGRKAAKQQAQHIQNAVNVGREAYQDAAVESLAALQE